MNETEQTTFSVPSPGELEQLTELHKAMGDYTRMRILWYLMQKDSCVSELAQKMEVTESAISHQLRALRIVRLVQSRKAGKSVIYSCRMNISGGFSKKPMLIFQKDKNAALCCFAGAARVFNYSVS